MPGPNEPTAPGMRYQGTSAPLARQLGPQYGTTGPEYGQGFQSREEREAAFESEKGKEYAGITVVETNNCCSQIWNDVRQFRMHFTRSGEYATQHNICSPSEKELLHRQTRGTMKPVIMNLLVWRRSITKLLVLLFTVRAAAAILSAWADFETAKDNLSTPPMSMTFAQWAAKHPAQKSFLAYSQAVLSETQRLMSGQAQVVLSIGSLVTASFDVLALLLVLWAMSAWTRFRASRQKLLLAWVLTIGGPFLTSTVPARLFVNWQPAEGVAKLYHDELSKMVAADDRIGQLQDACLTIQNKKADVSVASAEKTFHKVCSVVHDYLPQGKKRMPTSWNIFKWKKVDFAPAHSGCRSGEQAIAKGHPKLAVSKAREACDSLQPFLDGAKESGQFEKPAIVDFVADRFRIVAETTISLMLALCNVKTMFPAAISLAPGLLKGSIRMKMLCPQSIVPGMFVLILPWMSCPLAWCMYSLVFQVIGHVALLYGLLILAFTPTLYFVFGWKKELTRPMSDAEAQSAIGALERAVSWVSWISYAFLLYYMAHIFIALFESHADLTPQWADDFVDHIQDYTGLHSAKGGDAWGGKVEAEMIKFFVHVDNWNGFCLRMGLHIITFGCTFMSGLYLTAAAGFDWMVGEMIQFRKMEWKVWEARGDEEAARQASEGEERMDALVILNDST